MTRHPFRSLAVLLLAIFSAAVLSVTSTITSALVSTVRAVAAEVALLAGDEALIMGGSGLPIPGQDYIDALVEKYLDPNGYGGYDPQGLFTPEGLYPLTGVKSLPLDTSVDQGVTILNKALTDPGSEYAADDYAVLGYSQSAVISSLEMENLADDPNAPDAGDLAFVLLGDPMNPNGGLLSRFPDLVLPSLGVDFYGATPDDTVYDTDIYTLEYDGFADFPRYPINLLADINAFLGIATIHGTYPTLDQSEIDDATLLPGSVDYTGDLPDGVDAAEATNYWMIDQEAPLVSLLGSIPGIGKPLADLLGPDLTYLINLGYGDGDHGYSDAPANVPTPFGLFPDVDFGDVLNTLGDKTQQGIDAFLDDLGSLGSDSAGDTAGTAGDAADGAAAGFTDIVDAFSGAFSSLYATLLPTADILNALFVTLPSYDLSLVIDDLQSGDFLGALFDPMAANNGLVTLGLGFEFDVFMNAANEISDAFSGIF